MGKNKSKGGKNSKRTKPSPSSDACVPSSPELSWCRNHAEASSIRASFIDGNARFRSGDLLAAVTIYERTLIACVALSVSLQNSKSIELDLGYPVYLFREYEYGNNASTDFDRRIVHGIATLVRNLGMIFYRLRLSASAGHYLTECCEFKTLALESKSHYWKSVVLFQTGLYEGALDAISASIDLAKTRNSLSESLLKRNRMVRRLPAFRAHESRCFRYCDESGNAYYDFVRMFKEVEPGQDHPPYGEHNVKIRQACKRGLIAAGSFAAGDLIMVSRAEFSRKESRNDIPLPSTLRSPSSSLNVPILSIIQQRAINEQQQDLLRRLCRHLVLKNGKNPEEAVVLDEACFHFAEGMGAVLDNGEIDYGRVHSEMMKQEALCKKLLGKDFDGSYKDQTVEENEYLKSKGVTKLPLGEWRDGTCDESMLDEFVKSSCKRPGLDPFGDAMIKTLSMSEKSRLKQLWRGDSENEVFNEAILLRKIGLLHRGLSYDFKNGTELLLSSDGIEVHGVEKRLGIWLLPSFMNHSCVPNCKRVYVGHLCFVQALEDINEGDELTVSYNYEAFLNSSKLESDYGFKCKCRLCELPRSDQEEQIRYWNSVFQDKLLPKLVTADEPEKYVDYALKLLEKMDAMLDQWVAILGGDSLVLCKTLRRSHSVELYYMLVNALEKRPEYRFKTTAISLREKEVHEGPYHFGLVTLLAKQYMVVFGDHDKAKRLLPFETEVIKSLWFASMSSLSKEFMSGTMKSLLYLLDFPSSELLHGHESSSSY